MLTEDERKALVTYRLEKAGETLVEAKDCGNMNHWTLAANRLYYAAYYASSALLIQNEIVAKSHEGVIGMIGQNFVLRALFQKMKPNFWHDSTICAKQVIMMISLNGIKKKWSHYLRRLKNT